MIKKRPILLEELLIWLRGRLSMTGEEKTWVLLILVIIWVGLLGRYIHLKNQQPEIISIEELTGEGVVIKDK